MSDPGDLTILASVKSYLGITSGATDDKLSGLITACSAWIKSFLNRDILQSAYTEILNGTGGAQIMLANYPATALTSVTVDAIDVTKYGILDGRRVLTLTDGIFSKNYMNVVIKYTAGFATVPFDLEGVACRIVAWGYGESTRLGQVSKSMGGEVVSFSQASVPNWAKESLSNWRKVIG